jgi:DNA polymerase-1
MVMKDYSDMVALASAGMAEGYLQQVMQYDWPMPEKVMEIKPGGVVHYRQPQNISKLVSRMLNDAKSLKISREDLYGRWNKLDPDETSRSFVEACLGEMPIGNLSMVSREEAIWYSARDADATIRVHPYLWRQILDTDMTRVFDLDMGIVPVVKDMMETGITPLPDALNALGTRFGRSMAELEAQIKALTGVKAINLGSPLQVADLLFKKLRLKSLAKHGKLSTDDKTLGKLVGAHPAVPLIRQWRSYQKLKGTYADKLMQYAGEDGRIHAQLKITRTATGRLASAKPNIMNQPTRTDDGKAIRKCFSAGPGRVFVSNDLSQIEMRVLADQSGDPRLIQIFKEGLDIHSMTASGIFNVPIDQLDEMLHRYPSKRVGFGVVYGITAEGLREQLLMIGLDPNYWTLNRCSKLIDDWFGLYKDVDLYMADLEAFARRHGYVVDMFGRRRYLATVKSSNKWARAEALRQAGNMPIQSGAAGIFKAGMRATLDVYREINAQGGYARPVVPIHDDLVFEVDEDLVEIWVPLIQNAMENAVKLKVPILSEAKVGKIWGEQVKYTTEWGKA